MSTTPTTGQPSGFDTGTLPPRPPWWRRKLVVISAGGLALILAASIGAAAAHSGGQSASRPAATASAPAAILARIGGTPQYPNAGPVPAGPDAESLAGWIGGPGGETVTVWVPSHPGVTVAQLMAGAPDARPTAGNAVITGPGFYLSVQPSDAAGWTWTVPPTAIAAHVGGTVLPTTT